MVFTTTVFLFYFFPIFLGVYFALPRSARNGFLCIASYTFYGWWNPWFVLLMFGTTVVDYWCGLVISAPGASVRRRKLGVALSVVSNVALLSYFKYAAMGTETLNALLGALHRQELPVHAVALPIGLSFYTFQSMSYAIDLYRGHARPARSLLDFMTYVSLFPHLVAGPIVRYQVVSEQLRERRETKDEIARGVAYFMIGFGKKMLLANPMGDVADLSFGAGAPPWYVALFGVLAYTWQIYFDFSGYSDMAVGIGHMLGFQFPENFNAPHRAESFTDFWRRWHISLSTWLRENLYIPLGGNRGGRFGTYRNLFLTMLLGGLWHGAQWKYVMWGGVHGTMLAVEHATAQRSLYPWLPKPARVAATFALMLFTWVLFRADSFSNGLLYIQSMLGLRAADPAEAVLAARMFDRFHLLVFAVCTVVAFIGPRTRDFVYADGREAFRLPLRISALVALFLVSICEMWIQSANPFLYFQF